MSCDFLSLCTPGIKGLHPYQAGKPVDELERELGIRDIVKLASNENPLPLPESVKAAVAMEIKDLTRYPDSNGFYLKRALAEKLQVGSDQITLGNGSNDVLELVARVFVSAEHEVIFSEHAFVVYPLVTQAIGAQAVAVKAREWGHDLEAMADAISDSTRLIFIANPNNPTGTFLEKSALQDFLRSVPSRVMVVLDEAYFEYVAESERSPSIEWIERFPNLIVSRTFSKAYGLAGLRVGYAVSHPQVADLLNRLRQPFNVNSIALAAAKAALAEEDFLRQAVDLNNRGMAQLTEFFARSGVDFIPSRGNFVTFDVGGTGISGTEVYKKLLYRGVIVRPIGGYGMPSHLRVSIGTQVENEKFIQALLSLL
jgi:histidinol-phosphate aminotransferase